MKKSEDLLVKILIVLAGLTIGVVVVLTIIAYQIGVDELEKPNRIAIISGLLSMLNQMNYQHGWRFRMMDKEELKIKSPSKYFMEQNTLTDKDIINIIERGQFLNAKQVVQVGEWITEGLVKGLTQHNELPTKLEGSE